MTSTGPKIGIDSNILNFALNRTPATTAIGKSVKKAKNLMRHLLDDLNADVTVSVITVAEYLVPIAEPQHVSVTKMIEGYVSIAPFNIKAAQMAASIFMRAKAIRSSQPCSIPGDRDVLSADVKIIASLAAAGCNLIYSNDERFCKIANLVCKGILLPERINLLDDEEV